MSPSDLLDYLKKQYSGDIAAYDLYQEKIGQPFANSPVGKALSRALEPAKRFATGYLGEPLEEGGTSPAYEIGKILGTPVPGNLPGMGKEGLLLGGTFLARGVKNFDELADLTKIYRNLGGAAEKAAFRKQLAGRGLFVDPNTEHVSHWLNPAEFQVPINLKDTGAGKLPEFLLSDKLYKLRPDLQDVNVMLDPGTASGRWSPSKNMMTIGTAERKSPVTPKEVITHELGHALYGRELAGSNPEMFQKEMGRKAFEPSNKLKLFDMAKGPMDFAISMGIKPGSLVDASGEWTPMGKRFYKDALDMGYSESDLKALSYVSRNKLSLAEYGSEKARSRLAADAAREQAKMEMFYDSLNLPNPKGMRGEQVAYLNTAGEVAANFAADYPRFLADNPHLAKLNPYDVYQYYLRNKNLKPTGWDEMYRNYQDWTGEVMPPEWENRYLTTGMLK